MIPKLLLVVDVGGEKLALKIEEVLGVLDGPGIFPLPQIPALFRGVFLHREEAVPLLAPEQTAAKPRDDAETTEDAGQVVLCTVRGDLLGLPVRRVVKIVAPGEGRWLEEKPEETAASGPPLFEWGESRYRLLEIDALLQASLPRPKRASP